MVQQDRWGTSGRESEAWQPSGSWQRKGMQQWYGAKGANRQFKNTFFHGKKGAGSKNHFISRGLWQSLCMLAITHAILVEHTSIPTTQSEIVHALYCPFYWILVNQFHTQSRAGGIILLYWLSPVFVPLIWSFNSAGENVTVAKEQNA